MSVCILTRKRLSLELPYKERNRENGLKMHYSQKRIEDEEGIEEDTHKEQMKKEWAERYARRVRERKEEEQDETEKIGIITKSGTQSKGEDKIKETKKSHGGKRKAETRQQEVDEEEEEFEEKQEESSRKRRLGCINPQEEEEFQDFIKSITELMEMSNLPQYSTAWGDCDNKEMVTTRYMAAIVWYFLKREMCGMAPNVGNVADFFKVSRSQLSHLLTVKKFKSRPGGYIPKKKRMVTEEESSGAVGKAESKTQEVDDLESYLLS